jgi:hypothetical protein
MGEISLLKVDKCSGHDNLQLLARALETNTSLTEVHFVKMEDAGAHAIAQALENNRGLTSFHIVGGFGDVGVQAIGRALEINHRLKFLTIGGKWGNNGVQAVTQALRSNQCVTFLKIGNVISGDNDCLQALAETLQTHTCIISFLDFASLARYPMLQRVFIVGH